MSMNIFLDWAFYLGHIKIMLLSSCIGYLFFNKQTSLRALYCMLATTISCLFLKAMWQTGIMQSWGCTFWALPSVQVASAVSYWLYMTKEYQSKEAVASMIIVLIVHSWKIFHMGWADGYQLTLGWLFALIMVIMFDYLLSRWPRQREDLLGFCLSACGIFVLSNSFVNFRNLYAFCGYTLGGSLGSFFGTSSQKRDNLRDFDTVAQMLVAFAGAYLICFAFNNCAFLPNCRGVLSTALVGWWMVQGHQLLFYKR